MRRFEWHLTASTCGRFAPRRELAAAADSSCTRIRTASSRARPTTIRWSRHPRSYPRSNRLPRRYFAIILELEKRRVARPSVSRRIGDSRIRPPATSESEMTVSAFKQYWFCECPFGYFSSHLEYEFDKCINSGKMSHVTRLKRNGLNSVYGQNRRYAIS